MTRIGSNGVLPEPSAPLAPRPDHSVTQRPTAPPLEARAARGAPPPSRDGVDTQRRPRSPDRGTSPSASTGLPPAGGMTAAQRGAAIMRSRLYNDLPSRVQAQVSAAVQHIQQHGNASDMLDLQRMLASPFWAQATPEQQGELMSLVRQIALQDVDTHTPAQGRGVSRPMAALAEMAERRINGTSMLLTQASDGTTLVHQLERMSSRMANLPANHPVLQQTGLSPQYIAGGAILEVNDTGRIAQGNVGTCAATSLQLALIERQPAEYIRVSADLLVDGEATLANGAVMERVPSSIRPTPGNSRTPTERLFQSAVMDFAQGDTVYAINIETIQREVAFVDTLPLWAVILQAFLCFPALLIGLLVKVQQSVETMEEENTGLAAPDTLRAAQALFAEPWSVQYGNGEFSLRDLHERSATGDYENDSVQVSMRWSESEGDMHGYHALRLTRIDPEGTEPRMVYMHNPWGSSPRETVGSTLGSGAPPDAVWADPNRGLIAIPYDSFVDRLSAWHAPRRDAPNAEAELINPFATE